MSTSRTVRLSGGHTFPSKVVAVVLDALLLGGGLYFGGLSLGPFLFVAAVAALVQTPIWQAKEVLAEDSGLRVRGLRTEAVIPYDQIAEVRKPWLRSAVVHVHL